jgi:hypothetical protein
LGSETVVEVYIEEAQLIGLGTRDICRAAAKIRCRNSKGIFSSKWIDAKLDSCGSVSLSHSKYLTEIKTCKDYKLPSVSLKGIGEKTQPLQKAGILKVIKPHNQIIRFLCYVFDEMVGNTEQLLLLSMQAIKKAKINVQHHIDHSCEGRCVPLRFLEEYEGETLFADMDKFGEEDEYCPRKLYEEAILYEDLTSALLMTEIQLKNIVDRMGADPDTKTDGDETTVKDGIRISKFFKEAMEIGEDV